MATSTAADTERSSDDGDHVERQTPSDNLSNVLEEVRIILPGAQTLFGFQLIVVFEQAFRQDTARSEQLLHVAAMALTVVATAMLMTPAAYHRQVEPEEVSRGFIKLASRLIAWSTLPLAVAICIDLYLVATFVFTSTLWSIALAAALFVLIASLWYVLPRRRQR